MIVTKDDIVYVDDYATFTVNTKTNKSYTILIDIEDIKHVLNKTISINKGYCMVYNTAMYRAIHNIKNRTDALHNIVMNNRYSIAKNLVCDHKDRNTLNNRKYNLRITTRSVNAINSRQKGYYYVKAKDLWRVHIRFNKQLICTYFKTESEAIAERERLLKLYYPNLDSMKTINK